MSGLLYVMATPIGNLEDITLRALRVLKEADVIACEDTRVSKVLLNAYELKKDCLSLHQHSSMQKVGLLLDRVEKGEQAVYISDAGTPGMNDPGGKLVEAAFERGITVVPIPGASALTTAISACGFAMDEFHYVGFLPHKKGRQTLIKAIAERKAPTIFLESTHRIEKALVSLQEVLDEKRLIFVGRELTKKFETLYRGTVSEVIASLKETSLKGEFTIIVSSEK
ncbi:MAG: 16S rRNA (cytidine(1402)-2'-O)-methyltransferase [Candidatus Magasanikbacteria bacterium]|nr:16S rRNA (cytidine(1402)-2'-O)-methyltransferase [Candidatus Magasanikbacteria bacterium]